MVEALIRRNDGYLDELEVYIRKELPPAECEFRHWFTPNMYVREMSAKAGFVLLSRIHLTEHPFTVAKGKLQVSIDKGDWVTLEAGFTGITRAGTRRAGLVLEDCLFLTYHALPGITGEENDWPEEEKIKLIESIENHILEKYDNPLLIH